MSEPQPALVAGRPAGSPPAPAAPLRLPTVRRIATGIWVTVTGLQFAVWLVTCLVGAVFHAPWWVWTLLGGGVVVGALRLLESSRARTSTRPAHPNGRDHR